MPLTIRLKVRPLSALNKSNKIEPVGKKCITTNSLNQKELHEIRHAARNLGDNIRPNSRLRGPRSYR